MKKTYIISFLVIFLLIIVSYFGSYYFMKEKVKEVPMEKKEDVLKANSGTKMYTSDQTVYVLEKYDAATYELTEEKMAMPVEYVGLTREELMEKIKSYEKSPDVLDKNDGFTGFSLVYFSENKIVLRKTYNKNSYEIEYEAKIDSQGKIVIYISETGTIYTDTDIYYNQLPADVKEELESGKKLQGLREVFDFLENYSS